MADEKLTNDGEELDVTTVEGAADIIEDTVEDVPTIEQDEQEVAPAEETVAEFVEDTAVDERVEAAVRHVAEEAEADAAAGVIEEPAAPVQEEPRKKRERRSKQARAEKESVVVAEEPVAAKPSGAAKLGVPAWLGISAACLVLGMLLGRFVLGGSGAGGSGAFAGATSVAEADLDKTYASYVYKGETVPVTVREILEQNRTLQPDANGEYILPSAELALNTVRTSIVNKEIDARGIEVTDDEISKHAETELGTSDFDAIAVQYGMDADTVKEIIQENIRMTKLREDVIGDELPEAPTAPTTPDEGKEAEVTKDYADYIISLAGDEWSKKKGAWKSDDSAYATALADTDFTADGASYNTAQTAYYVAYQKYSEKQTELSTKWTEFLNGLLSNASIQIDTVVS